MPPTNEIFRLVEIATIFVCEDATMGNPLFILPNKKICGGFYSAVIECKIMVLFLLSLNPELFVNIGIITEIINNKTENPITRLQCYDVR